MSTFIYFYFFIFLLLDKVRGWWKAKRSLRMGTEQNARPRAFLGLNCNLKPMVELFSAGLSPYQLPPDEDPCQQGVQARVPLKAALANLSDP